ncbi:MAG: 6-bladed beta-propeller [Balneolaceae bacterium]|nr:6-bladed beta-propeller [Balneolaceae bacterium]
MHIFNKQGVLTGRAFLLSQILVGFVFAALPNFLVAQSELQAKKHIFIESSEYLNSFTIHEDKIYSIDRYLINISIHDMNGAQIKRVGRSGNGPGEFNDPPNKIFHHIDSPIAVIDDKRMEIKLYDKDLNLLKKSLKLRLPPSDADYSKKGEFIICTLPLTDNDSITIFDQNQKLISSFSPDIAPGNFLLNSFYVNALPDEKILVSYRFKNLFQVYNKDGILTDSFRLPDFPSVVETVNLNTDSPHGKNIPKDLMFFSPSVDENGHIFILSAKYGLHANRMVYQVEPTGTLINTFILDQKSGQIKVNDNKLYSLSTADPNSLLVYSLVE